MLGIIPAGLCLFSLARVVSAGIYGTSPVASTVWSAGRSERVSWTDDRSAPRLNDMGDVSIELLTGDEMLVATLAQGVPATTKSLDVWISPAWGHNNSDYYIRFTCDAPPSTVYTASFTIFDMSTIPALTPGPSSSSSTSSSTSNNNTTTLHPRPNQTTTDPSISMYTPYLTLVLPNATITSALAPRPTVVKPPMGAPPVSNDEEAEYLKHDHAQIQQTSDAGGGTAGHRMDLERLKFRLVFILWPALVGITMAL